MKTKQEIKEKEFDTVKTFRAIKEKISADIADMNLEQIREYLKDKKVRVKS
jgi:CO dehydrogenase/acetyl-CoA synthase epsilon subunit